MSKHKCDFPNTILIRRFHLLRNFENFTMCCLTHANFFFSASFLAVQTACLHAFLATIYSFLLAFLFFHASHTLILSTSTLWILSSHHHVSLEAFLSNHKPQWFWGDFFWKKQFLKISWYGTIWNQHLSFVLPVIHLYGLSYQRFWKNEI